MDSQQAQPAQAADSGSQGQPPSERQLELINAWAYSSEVVIHGEPSGLDNTTRFNITESEYSLYLIFFVSDNGPPLASTITGHQVRYHGILYD